MVGHSGIEAENGFVKSTLPPAMSSPTPLSTLESFFCGGLAACVAVSYLLCFNTVTHIHFCGQVTISNPSVLK
jgi:hypothetical protein